MPINAVRTLVVTGGLGWTTGDVITLTGGTFTTAATAIVTATLGVIDSVAFGSRGFGYTAVPTGFTGIGTGGTIDAVTVGVISAPYITDLTISGGTLYVVGDILTLTGGTPTTAAKARVTTIGGGGDITATVFETRGADYDSAPTGFTGGSGSGATITYVTVGAIPPGTVLQPAIQGPATLVDVAQSAQQPVIQGPATLADVAQSVLQPSFARNLIPLKFASNITALSIRPLTVPVPVITPALTGGMTTVAGTAAAPAVTVKVTTLAVNYFSAVVANAWSVSVPALAPAQVVEARGLSVGALFESPPATVVVAPAAVLPDLPFPPHQSWAYGNKPL